jgi:hypothetical protein
MPVEHELALVPQYDKRSEQKDFNAAIHRDYLGFLVEWWITAERPDLISEAVNRSSW